MMLSRACYLDLSGSLAYYYTAGPGCAPGAPGFTYSYYLTVSRFVGAIGGGLGSVLFQGMASWTFRQAFWVTTAVQILASSFDLVIVKRWNLQVGVSDELAYLFGDAMVQQLSIMLQMMPMALLTSSMCPRGAEATVYAILAGFQNLGCSVSSVLGVWLTQSLGVETSGAADPLGSCDFSNLGTAIAVAHLALPLLSVPLTFLLVPAAPHEACGYDSARHARVTQPTESHELIERLQHERHGSGGSGAHGRRPGVLRQVAAPLLPSFASLADGVRGGLARGRLRGHPLRQDEGLRHRRRRQGGGAQALY